MGKIEFMLKRRFSKGLFLLVLVVLIILYNSFHMVYLLPLEIFLKENSDLVFRGDCGDGYTTDGLNGRYKCEWPFDVIFNGNFVDGKRNGYGIQKWGTFKSYEGNWYEDLRHGKGKMVWNNVNGIQIYDGEWVAGFRCGKGRELYQGKVIKEGYWEFDKYVGLSSEEAFFCGKEN